MKILLSARAIGSANRQAEIRIKAASIEGDTAAPLSAALLDGS